ncbi:MULTISPECIES: monovalent cation:proton antiporter-2 (CPA2) family protein [unclassified Methylophilus]|uniref:monovalent cation:proton antiporter-2 (CPA2) family protein n=1 Tax=unclassified Methylophilus TaxID=2630143 RepID=UPI0006F69249|nr:MULTISPECIES: monovalent cation:proton antiporter-2 (CPA2) family protein [unclassified Methylophilus]KQT41379.1 potassium transporter KefC [Methylophilus sp. Leaf416]KQT57900.1 potassium transporter KefC [Methylophilus sp. Leaf459]
MDSSHFLVQAAIYLSAALILVPIFKRLGLGSVLGYLIAGILIGPYAMKLIADPEHVLHFAEFGVVLMLFLIGLELESQKVWELRKLLFGLGGMQVTLTILVVTVIAHTLRFSWSESIIIGMGVAMSSTAIGLTALIEKKQLHTSGGQAAFATLLFQDLSVIPLFMLLAFLAPDRSASSFDLLAVTKAIAVIVAIVLASRTVLRPIMRAIAQTGVREIFVAFSLLLVIGISLAMESVGLSMALGTFLAGVLLADSEYRYELRLDIEPVKGLLLGLFFIAVGMTVDLSLVANQPLLIFGFALLIVAIKIGVLMGLGWVFKYSLRDKLLFGFSISQIGEFAFVIFGLALAQNSISRETYNILNAIVAVSMLTTPILLLLYDRFLSLQCSERPKDAIPENNSVIIAGFGRFGQIVGRVLVAKGITPTLIDNDPNQVDLMRDFGWRCYYGDASRLDLLEEAGIAEAKLLVIAVNDSAAALEMAKLVKERWPAVAIVARARSRTDAFDLRELDLNPIRETFYSSLEAARQSLLAIGESASVAEKVVRQFEKHDLDQLEATLKIRHDRKAISSLMEQGRQDLKTLLELESPNTET